MEQLVGENINVLPFKEITKVSDLIYFEGPVLSHFNDKYGKNILFYWVDLNEDYNRWLVFQISEEQLYKYLAKQISLRSLIDFPVNDIFYSVEIGDSFEYKNILQIFKDDLVEKYIPENDSFFEFEVPTNYLKKLNDYKDSFVLESFLQQAMYLKAEPQKKVKSKNLGLVTVLDSADFLYSFGCSYKELISFKVRKEFYNRSIVDEKRVKKAIKQVTDNSLLNLVKTKAASFAIALSPNNIMTIDESFLNKEWRDDVFRVFKQDVIEIDKKTEEEVEILVRDYGEGDISDIYKPIIKLYNNKDIEINITDRNFTPKRTIHSIKDNIVTKLVTIKNESSEEAIDRLALVKYNSKTNRITGTAQATFFDQAIQTSWTTDEIRTEKKTYKLRHKLFANYKIENRLHIIEQENLDIYATGDSLTEAETNFYSEFHSLYESLIPKENNELSYQQIEIKAFLTLYVKKP